VSKYKDYRENVLRVSQELWREGYFGTKHGSGGNVSALIDGEEAIAVTPSAKNYGELTWEDICVIDFDKNAIEGASDPSVEAGMHLAVYKARADVSAVVHTHQPFASIFAVLNESIPPLFDEVSVAIGPEVAVCPYGLSGSPELLQNVVSKLENRCHCYLLQNHGALSIGPDLDRALYFTEVLEKTARIYYRALSTGMQVDRLPDGLPEALFQFTKSKQDAEIARKEALKEST
jgi:ribulose-5-phosphate 4-epimerase/fuculose-1-phosphate aldolase